MKRIPLLPRVLLELAALAFPSRLRKRYGQEMKAFLEAEYTEAREGGRTGLAFWLPRYWGLLREGLGARLDGGGSGRRNLTASGHRSGLPRRPALDVPDLLRTGRGIIRSLVRSPGFSLTSIATLALAVGGVSVIFSVLYPVLLAPLPYPEADQLVVVEERSPGPQGRGGWVSPLTFREWRERQEVFTDLVGYRLEIFTRTDGEAPELLRGWAVSAGFFPLMGVNMTLGRGFTPEEDGVGAPAVLVISHGLWTRSFAQDPDILGKSMILDGAPFTIVGVAGPELAYPSRGEYWHPIGLDYGQEFRDFRYLGVLGRIRPGAGLSEAKAEVERLARSVEEENPATNAGWGGEVTLLKERIVGGVRPVLLGMGVAVALLLIISMGNLTNLTMARAVSRRPHGAIRQALGAGWAILARRHFAEALLLALAGGGGGVLLASWGLKLLSRSNLLHLPRLREMALDGRSVLVGMAAALGVGLVLGVVSLLAGGRQNLAVSLKAGGPGGMASGGSHRVREMVLATQVALALVLLIGATHLTRSLLSLSRVDAGFEPQGLMTFSYDLPSASYPDPEAIRVFESNAMDRVGSLPGVEAAGIVTPLPLEMGSVPSSWSLPPDVRDPALGPVMAHMRTASPGYFPAMGLTLLAGRLLNHGDRSDSESVALVNQAFVESYLQGRDPLGTRVTWGEPDAGPEAWATIVGVVEDVRFTSLRSRGEPELYLPSSQLPSGWGHLVVRSRLSREAVAEAVTTAIQQIDPNLPLSDIRAGDEIISSQLRTSRLSALLTSLFALTSTLLAAVGILGVLSILVAQRMREIGLRMVLGAAQGSIWRFILFKGMRPVLVGLVLGLLGAVGGTRLLGSQIHGVSALDPLAFLLPLCGLGLVSFLACLTPGARAASADPVDLLHVD